MAPRTRSIHTSPFKKLPATAADLTNSSHDPLAIIIAPRCLSKNAVILTLPHPSNGAPGKFLFCCDSGLHELKRTTVPSNDPRSVLIVPAEPIHLDAESTISATQTCLGQGYINQHAEVLTATPYDISFVLLRTIAPPVPTTKKALFQPLEDLLDGAESGDQSLRHILSAGHAHLRIAMTKICDTVEAGDEVMYRYSEEKVAGLVLEKAIRVAESGLPASLEERFVTRILEAPMSSIKREESNISIVTSTPTSAEAPSSQDENIDSQSTTASTAVSSVFSDASIATSLATDAADGPSAGIKRLQRIRTAYKFITATCIPTFVAARFAEGSPNQWGKLDFGPLDDYLKHVAQLRAEAAVSRSMTDFSRKRGPGDAEAAEERAEKKRKLEEEEKKRKANESRGVRDLKKVNVSGMKKMSDFFTKKPAVAKAKT